jgi:hypothetical protein
MGEIAHSKRRELRASLDFGRPGCFRDERSVRREQLRIRRSAISGGVERVSGPRNELQDLDGIGRRERVRACSDGGRSRTLRG